MNDERSIIMPHLFSRVSEAVLLGYSLVGQKKGFMRLKGAYAICMQSIHSRVESHNKLYVSTTCIYI